MIHRESIKVGDMRFIPRVARIFSKGMMRPVLLVALCAVLALPLVADALSVGEAKRAGLVQETANGYLRAVPGKGGADVQALVRETNNARRAEYRRISGKLKVDIGVVEKDFGRKLGGR